MMNVYFYMKFKKNFSKTKRLTLIHFNARSLKANFKKITDYLAELDLQFDIIAISETWAELDLISDYNINNYSGYHITRCDRRGGDLAIYTS